MTRQEYQEVIQGTLSPEKVSMTLAEFLEYDIGRDRLHVFGL